MSDTTPIPETIDVEALLAKVQDEHWACPSSWNKSDGTWEFACGAVMRPKPGNGFTATFRAHLVAALAAVLVPWVAQQRADALREAAAEIRRDHGVPTRRDANWSYRNGYFDGAMHAADVVKRRIARADRIAPTTEGGQR